ncbi:metallophosphoesterase [Treponema sp. R80B11-R83G3]
MKIAIVTDIHGSTNWRMVMKRVDEFDKIIFLGDYFDAWTNKWPGQMNNACNIITFKKRFPKKVDLCWANHDTSYYLGERCSGYQLGYAVDIIEFFNKHKEQFEVVYIYDEWIFSHAGVSEEWMSCAGIKTVEEINTLFKESPNYFRWVGPDNFGDNPNEGPLWIRPKSLMNNAVKNYNQAVGHTELYDGPKVICKNKLKFVFTDTGKHDHLTIVDTETNEVTFKNIAIL